MLLRLSFKERQVVSRVAKLYKRIASNAYMNAGADPEDFMNISFNSLFGFLYKDEYRKAITALETLGNLLPANPQLDPFGQFKDALAIAEKMKANPKYQQYINSLPLSPEAQAAQKKLEATK